MRTVLAIATASHLLAGFALAQGPVAKGVWSVGGSARIVGLHDDANDVNEFTIEVTPQLGYFVVSRLAVSGSIRLSYSTRENSGRTLGWGVGPGLTYYVKGFGSRFYPYTSFHVLFSRSTFTPSETVPSGSRVKGRARSWHAGVGGALFVARNVAVTIEGFYSKAAFKDRIELPGGPIEQRNTSSLFGVQFGIRTFIY